VNRGRRYRVKRGFGSRPASAPINRRDREG
jgi:hypothetical protein